MGASRGIGRATESLVAAIQAKGGGAQAISADFAAQDGAASLAKQVRSSFGDWLDVLVLNAGITQLALIADHTVEDLDNLLPLWDQRPRPVLRCAAAPAHSW